MPVGRFNEIWQRLRTLVRRKQLERDLEEELAFHLAMRAQDNRRAGLEIKEAGYAARRQFGNTTQVKENSFNLRRWVSIETIWQDVRYGARSLRKSPAFTAIAVLTLALGIGAPTAIFSLIDSVVLQPLPFTQPGRLVGIFSTKGGLVIGGPSALDVRDFARNNHSPPSFKALLSCRRVPVMAGAKPNNNVVTKRRSR
jgi:hypothetical protein